MDQVKAKMQALRAQADAAQEKSDLLEKKLKDTEAKLHEVRVFPSSASHVKMCCRRRTRLPRRSANTTCWRTSLSAPKAC